jgi:hypothetical protein
MQDLRAGQDNRTAVEMQSRLGINTISNLVKSAQYAVRGPIVARYAICYYAMYAIMLLCYYAIIHVYSVCYMQYAVRGPIVARYCTLYAKCLYAYTQYAIRYTLYAVR